MIRVDDREARMHPQAIQTIRKNLGVANVTVKHMEFSDYAFDGVPVDNKTPRVGIELSTVLDVMQKIQTGRLARQLIGLTENFDVSILLIESPITLDAKTGKVKVFGTSEQFAMDYNLAKAALYSAACHGIQIEYASGRKDAADRIIHWYRWWQKPPAQHTFMRRQDAEISIGMAVPIAKPLERAITTLMQGPNIGETLARAALHQYHSLEVIYNLPEKQLSELEGWGPVIAKQFREYTSKWMNVPKIGKRAQ